MNTEERLKNQDEVLEQHTDMLSQHTKILEDQTQTLKRIENFMTSLSGFNNFVRGIELLRKPALWFIAVIVGLVTLLGGLKALVGLFISFFITKE